MGREGAVGGAKLASIIFHSFLLLLKCIKILLKGGFYLHNIFDGRLMKEFRYLL